MTARFAPWLALGPAGLLAWRVAGLPRSPALMSPRRVGAEGGGPEVGCGAVSADSMSPSLTDASRIRQRGWPRPAEACSGVGGAGAGAGLGASNHLIAPLSSGGGSGAVNYDSDVLTPLTPPSR